MRVRVADLRPGDRFLWKADVAVVHDLDAMPEHIMSPTHGMVYSLDVEVPKRGFRGAVQVLGSVTVEKVS